MDTNRSLYQIYRPYMPAFVTFMGALMVALGLFVTQFHPLDSFYQWLRFFGAIIAATGALWSIDRQVQSSTENKILTNKIINLSEQLNGQITGGDSFCYAHPNFQMAPPGFFQWVFIHQGTFSLSDLTVRIYDLDNPTNYMGKTYKLETLLAERVIMYPEFEARKPTGSYNLFFAARNGGWTQEIRWCHINNEISAASRIKREFGNPADPLYLKIADNFPKKLPPDGAWKSFQDTL